METPEKIRFLKFENIKFMRQPLKNRNQFSKYHGSDQHEKH